MFKITGAMKPALPCRIRTIVTCYIARGGQIVDATIVAVPRQRNTREENEAVKGGRTPVEWKKRPAKNRQKDKDARWTKKHGNSFFGYKNHVKCGCQAQLIRRYEGERRGHP